MILLFDVDMPLEALAIVPKKCWAVKPVELSGIGVICETWSFPSRHGGTGMTGGSRGSPFRMTPAPTGLAVADDPA
jgi:hypothetical protein